MLQQTRVAAVLPYFQRFMEAFPTVEALAQADTERLMKLWEGLGYYSRARNLQKAARILTEQYGGRFPETYRELTALPGIGDYTAGAILSIAFGQAVPAVDGNVLRLAARITGSCLDVLDAKNRIWGPRCACRRERLCAGTVPPGISAWPGRRAVRPGCRCAPPSGRSGRSI